MKGWKLVPVEPDGKMDDAGLSAFMDYEGFGYNGGAANAIYTAMLAAAPEAPRLTEAEIAH